MIAYAGAVLAFQPKIGCQNPICLVTHLGATFPRFLMGFAELKLSTISLLMVEEISHCVFGLAEVTQSAELKFVKFSRG